MNECRRIINYLDVVPLLSDATPSFASSAQAERAVAEDGAYLEVTHFVRHLINQLAAGQTAGFDLTFRAVEEVLALGDDEAIQLMWFGFFDDLLQPAMYADTGHQPADFAPWLGPLASRFPPLAAVLRDD